MRMMRTRDARARRRSSVAMDSGMRLCTRAFGPHEPGCSTISHLVTNDAVPIMGSRRASDASEQRKNSAGNDYLEEPLSNETSNHDETVVRRQELVQLSNLEGTATSNLVHHRLEAPRNLQLAIDK